VRPAPAPAPAPARACPAPLPRCEPRSRPPLPVARGAGATPHLRGCIGTLEPTEIPRGLKELALTSALRDRRFPPIGHAEVWQLHCGVSLLHSYEGGRAWDDWEPGRHGVVIRFPDPGSRRSMQATFLPEIAEREGWDQRETMEHLVRKAGWRGGATGDVLASIDLTRYQSSYCALTYGEYKELSRLPSVREDSTSGASSGSRPRLPCFS